MYGDIRHQSGAEYRLQGVGSVGDNFSVLGKAADEKLRAPAQRLQKRQSMIG